MTHREKPVGGFVVHEFVFLSDRFGEGCNCGVAVVFSQFNARLGYRIGHCEHVGSAIESRDGIGGQYKFTASLRNNPKFNDDGSLTLYFQNDSPGKEKEANWLPAPNGPIYLVMRLYWPKETPPSILPAGKGTWQPPGLVAAS